MHRSEYEKRFPEAWAIRALHQEDSGRVADSPHPCSANSPKAAFPGLAHFGRVARSGSTLEVSYSKYLLENDVV
jgi:hypothetical protein